MNKQAIFDKFVEFMGRFAEIRAVAALRDGFIMTTPFTVCGSVFLLIANLPIPGYPEFMANLFGKDWTAPLNAVAGGTFSVVALIAVLAITYKYVEAEGCDAIMASILSLSTFLIVLPPTVMSKGGEAVGDVIPKAWAGIHGPNVVGGVVSPILIANSLDNQALIDAGQQLMGNPSAKIITCQVNDVFIKSGGCGLTFGLLIASWLSSQSSQMKSLTKLATVPGFFNINEPIIFGLPIVFNPFLLVPFVLVPLFALFLTYGAIAVGFMAPFSAVQVPWTTPPILAGLLLDGW